MKLIEKLKTRLAPVGVTVDEYDSFFCLDAPAGYVWRATGEPSLTIHFGNHSQTWLAAAIRAEKQNIDLGLERVDDAKRLEEIQYALDDDDWKPAANAPQFLIPAK